MRVRASPPGMPINFLLFSDAAVSRTKPYMALALKLYEGTLMKEGNHGIAQ